MAGPFARLKSKLSQLAQPDQSRRQPLAGIDRQIVQEIPAGRVVLDTRSGDSLMLPKGRAAVVVSDRMPALIGAMLVKRPRVSLDDPSPVVAYELTWRGEDVLVQIKEQEKSRGGGGSGRR